MEAEKKKKEFALRIIGGPTIHKDNLFFQLVQKNIGITFSRSGDYKADGELAS